MVDQSETAVAWDCVLRASEHASSSDLKIVSALHAAIGVGDVAITVLMVDAVINLAKSTASKDLIRTHRFVRIVPRTRASWNDARLLLVPRADATDLVVAVQQREQLFAAAVRAAQDGRAEVAMSLNGAAVTWSEPLQDDGHSQVQIFKNPSDDEVARLVAAGARDARGLKSTR